MGGMKIFKILIVQIVVSVSIFPCSIFSYYGESSVYMAGNEDYIKLNSSIRFVQGSNKYNSYAVLAPNGFLDTHPQIAINSKGLAVDWATVPKGIYKRNKKKRDLASPLIPELMKSCGTVEEVKAFVESYNIDHFAYEHLMVADSRGNSAVIEWDGRKLNYIEGYDDYLLVTNFNLADGDPMECDRYMNGGSVLNLSKDDDFTKILKTLDIMHQEGEYPTLYSYIFDLKKNDIYIFNNYDFSMVSKLNLEAAISEGLGEIDLRDLEYSVADGF